MVKNLSPKATHYLQQMLTIAFIHTKVNELVGQEIVSPITANKGAVGLLLETITGIPHSSNTLDCLDGELKVFPVKKLQNGTRVPKETIAVTMLSKELLKTTPYSDSGVCKKLQRTLYVPYERSGDIIKYLTPTFIDMSLPQYVTVCTAIQADYETIKQKYITSGTLSSTDGVYLQNRTKGPGGRQEKTRAFYLRKEFAKRYITLSQRSYTAPAAP